MTLLFLPLFAPQSMIKDKFDMESTGGISTAVYVCANTDAMASAAAGLTSSVVCSQSLHVCCCF